MVFSRNHCLHIGVDYVFWYCKFFAKDIKLSITADEPNKGNGAVRDIVEFRHLGVWPQRHRHIIVVLDNLHGCLALKATVSMISVVEALKILALPFEGSIAWEPLPSKEFIVIGIVKVLNNPIAPGFSNGNKHRLNPVEKTQPYHQAKGAGIAVASPKTQFIVELKKIRHPHALPASHQAASDVTVIFASLSLKVNPMAQDIHDIECVELAVTFYVPRTD